MASKPTSNKVSNKPTSGDDILTGTKAANFIDALAGNDQVSGGGGDDRLYGNAGKDTLIGEDGNDFLLGGTGDDTLSGGTGNDDLRGEDGNDTLDEGSGNGAVNGGAGADVLTGGAGADHFDYGSLSNSVGANVDVITDYSLAEGDDLVFAALDANLGEAGLQPWNYVAELGDYNGPNGQAMLTFDAESNTTTLNLYNNDGDTTADFTVIFEGQYGVGDIQITLLDMAGGPSMDGIIWPVG
jgi:Ca2+-binding RTX toxin-like protein